MPREVTLRELATMLESGELPDASEFHRQLNAAKAAAAKIMRLYRGLFPDTGAVFGNIMLTDALRVKHLCWNCHRHHEEHAGATRFAWARKCLFEPTYFEAVGEARMTELWQLAKDAPAGYGVGLVKG